MSKKNKEKIQQELPTEPKSEEISSEPKEVVHFKVKSNFSHLFDEATVNEEDTSKSNISNEQNKKLSTIEKNEDKNNNKDEEITEKKSEDADKEKSLFSFQKTDIDWKTRAEKEAQRLKETQKWAHETKMQMSAYKKAVEKLRDERILDEEEANQLLDYTESREMPLEALSEREKASKIFSHEIENIRKYGNYKNLDEHVKALDHLVDNSTPEEIQELFAEAKYLADDDPVVFTKKILEVAERYYDEIYEDFLKAGNLKNLRASFEEEIAKRDKAIDKLEKELLKMKKTYEDYDEKHQYRIPQSGEVKTNSESSSSDVLGNPGKFLSNRRKTFLK